MADTEISNPNPVPEYKCQPLDCSKMKSVGSADRPCIPSSDDQLPPQPHHGSEWNLAENPPSNELLALAKQLTAPAKAPMIKKCQRRSLAENRGDTISTVLKGDGGVRDLEETTTKTRSARSDTSLLRNKDLKRVGDIILSRVLLIPQLLAALLYI